MKKLILFLSFMILGSTIIFGQAAAIINVQEPQSFRSQALGGTVDDDLDLVYDPIELRFVNGMRLYTNLSNLISSDENFLDNNSEDEFLAGFSMENPFVKSLWNAVLFQYKNDRDPVVEYAKEIDNDYYDSGTDGLIDTRDEMTTEVEDYEISKRSAFILNNSYLFGDLTFGLRYATASESREGISAGYIDSDYLTLGTGWGSLSGATVYSPSFSNTFNRYMLGLNNFRTIHWEETGDFLGESEFSYTNITFSAMKPFYLSFDTLEVRADLQYMPLEELYNQNDVYSGREQHFNRDIPNYLDTYQESDRMDFTSDIDGSVISFNAGVKQVFKSAAERKDNGFWELNAGLSIGSGELLTKYDNTFSSRERFNDGVANYHDQIAEKYQAKEDGDLSINAYYGSFRLNLPLGERVHAGAGIAVSTVNTKLDLKYADTYQYARIYETVDGVSDAADYTITGSSTLEEDRTYEEYFYNVSIPVGIEYKFTNNKKWSLRFGSIFTYSKMTVNISNQNTKSEPYSDITQLGDGSAPTISDVSRNQYTSTSDQLLIANSITTYVYGLGFNPTENLQIDLLGYLGNVYDEQIIDARFLRHLRLSFTLKL